MNANEKNAALIAAQDARNAAQVTFDNAWAVVSTAADDFDKAQNEQRLATNALNKKRRAYNAAHAALDGVLTMLSLAETNLAKLQARG